MSKKLKSSKNKAEDVETKPVELSLSVKDRLTLSALLPTQSDILTQVLSRDIQAKTRFTQLQMKKLGLKPSPGGGMTWDAKVETATNIIFTEAEMTLLRAQVDVLDKEKKITPDILSLCLKIREVKNG